MAIDNLPSCDQNRLSGTYIRTLVKQLTSSKPTYNTKENSNLQPHNNNNNIIIASNNSENLDMAKQKISNTGLGNKKQVRRRLHTSRPYQERLLNMAEARKEIVTALKFHRATMKQASEKKQPPQQTHYQLPQPKIETLTYNNTNVMMDNFSYYNNNNNNNCYPWVMSSLPNIPLNEGTSIIQDTLNIQLPNQTLGLNLNLQAFANLDTSFYNYNYNNINTTTITNYKYSSTHSPMSPSSSSSSTPIDLFGAVSRNNKGVGAIEVDNMHPCLDEEEMVKIRSIGEQHQMEWDDTLDLVKWFKFVKNVEFEKENIKVGGESNYNNYCGNYYYGNYYGKNEGNFEEFMEFPTWLSGDDQSLLEQHLEDSCSEGTSLPWVDIGDIDGMDDEWLS